MVGQCGDCEDLGRVIRVAVERDMHMSSPLRRVRRVGRVEETQNNREEREDAHFLLRK